VAADSGQLTDCGGAESVPHSRIERLGVNDEHQRADGKSGTGDQHVIFCVERRRLLYDINNMQFT